MKTWHMSDWRRLLANTRRRLPAATMAAALAVLWLGSGATLFAQKPGRLNRLIARLEQGQPALS